MDSNKDDQFSPEDTQKRFEASLRGARIAGHKPMKSMTPKRAKAQPEKKETGLTPDV